MSITGATYKFNIKICKIGEIKKMIDKRRKSAPSKEDIKWASTRENMSSVVCEQQRHRPACASAQSDQRLCYSLFGTKHMLPCYR